MLSDEEVTLLEKIAAERKMTAKMLLAVPELATGGVKSHSDALLTEAAMIDNMIARYAPKSTLDGPMPLSVIDPKQDG